MYLQKEEFSYYTQQFSKFGGLRPSSLRRMPPSLPALTRGSPGITKNEPIREQFLVNRNIDIIEARVPKNTLNQTLAMVVYLFSVLPTSIIFPSTEF